MPHGGHSVLFAALLLVAQLLFGVLSAGVATHGGTQHCDGCPDVHSSSMAHGMGSTGSDCGSHCADASSTGHQQRNGCGSGCTMAGSSHCGSSMGLALNVSTSVYPDVSTGTLEHDRRSVDLPDSPLFDFLRPPTRG
jgi:hypothetical protein